jgi:hypothetical protein
MNGGGMTIESIRMKNAYRSSGFVQLILILLMVAMIILAISSDELRLIRIESSTL